MFSFGNCAWQFHPPFQMTTIIVANSKMMSFIGYMNTAVIKSLIYFTLHMHITVQLMAIIPWWFYVFYTLCRTPGTYTHCLCCFFTYLKYHISRIFFIISCDKVELCCCVLMEGWWMAQLNSLNSILCSPN